MPQQDVHLALHEMRPPHGQGVLQQLVLRVGAPGIWLVTASTPKGVPRHETEPSLALEVRQLCVPLMQVPHGAVQEEEDGVCRGRLHHHLGHFPPRAGKPCLLLQWRRRQRATALAASASGACAGLCHACQGRTVRSEICGAACKCAAGANPDNVVRRGRDVYHPVHSKPGPWQRGNAAAWLRRRETGTEHPGDAARRGGTAGRGTGRAWAAA